MIKVYINGEQVVSNDELIIKQEMLTTSSTILNNCYPIEWESNKDYVSNFFYPKDYSKCTIYDDDELIFCGVVKNTGNISLNPFQPKYCSLQILDFKTFLSEGESLDFVISNKTILEAIQMVVDAVASYGVVLGNVNILNENDKIGAYSTLNKTAYDVFQYLAEISNSRWTTRVIDENTIAVDFFDSSLMPQGTQIDYTKEFFEENKISDLSFNYGTRDYRNKQIMTSDEVYADISYTDKIITDGYATKWNLQSNIGRITNITVNGESVSFATNDEKDAGIDADFYFTPGSNVIEADETYEAATKIIVYYVPLVQGRQIVYNNSEIARIQSQTSRNGVVARYENRNDIISSSDLRKVGQTYIKYKGTPEIKLKVTTQRNLWNVGQSVYFDAPINELKTDYMVKQKQIRILSNSDTIFYTYELTSSFNSEQEINYFDNQRNKTSGNIAEGDYITRNVDYEYDANIIWDSLNIEELELSTTNVLDFELDAPFTS